MGIPLSRVQTDAPAWFPVDKFEEHLIKEKQREHIVFPGLEKSLKAVNGIDDVVIKREKIYGGLCTQIRATITQTTGRPRPTISGTLPPGIKFGTSYLDPPFSLFIEYVFSAGQKIADISVTHPLAAKADFSREHPFETMGFRFMNSEQRLFNNVYRTNQLSMFISCGDRVKQTLISHVKMPDGVLHKNGMAYYEPKQYVKLSSYIAKKSRDQSYLAEIATLLTEKAIIPYIKLDSDSIARFWRFFDVRFRGGAILSTRAVPIKERFDPSAYMIGMGSIFSITGSTVNSFCPKSGGVPTGADAYAIARARCNLEIFKKLHFHVFAQAGVSILQKSNYFIDGTPLYTGLASYGCGGKLTLGKMTVLRLDYSVPVYESPGIKCPSIHFCLAIE